MNRSISFLILTLIVFTSCNGLGSVDSSIQTRNLKVPSTVIIGTWKMDKFSYKYLSAFKTDSIKVTFKEDYSFIINNSESLFERKIDNNETSGTWKINDQYQTATIELNFKGKKGSKTLNIFKKENDYQLWYFLSDPDMGERIRFLK